MSEPLETDRLIGEDMVQEPAAEPPIEQRSAAEEWWEREGCELAGQIAPGPELLRLLCVTAFSEGQKSAYREAMAIVESKIVGSKS